MTGILKFVREENENYFEIEADFDTELVLRRLIPSSMGGLRRGLLVRIHPDNTKILRMVMREFPLEIENEKKWNEAQKEIELKIKLAKEVEKLDLQLPDSGYFVGKLMEFQKEGLDFLLKTEGNTLLTDEMGLGKTCQTLAFISRNAKDLPIVVVAPLVTLINWKREIEKFLRLDFMDYGKQKRIVQGSHMPIINIVREGKERALPLADITLINYELVKPRLKDLIGLQPKTIVYDEIHSLRNDDTSKYYACKTLASQECVKHRIGLSGTPIYNRGTEMFNICEIIKPGLLGERDEFIRKFCNYYSMDTKEEVRDSLYQQLRSSIMIRRKKVDVLKDLKDKVKLKQTIMIDKELYMRGISELYQQIEDAREGLKSMVLENEKKEGLFSLNKRIREMTVKERQIAGLAKAPYVVEYLRELLEGYEDEKFVVFCHHLAVHQILYDGLRRYNPVKIIGGQDDKERQWAIDRFQNSRGNDSRVIICGLRAGSLGINLTSASYVIFAELDWSPSVHKQAEDRLHRLGQKNVVFSHYLEGEGTFDEIISQKLINKTVTINDMLGDKMETLDNEKAVQFLHEKFRLYEKNTNSTLMEDLHTSVNPSNSL